MTESGVDIAEGLGSTKVVGPQLISLLRNRIIRGELPPGTRMSEAEVAAAYGISRQPVREAFIRLADASLIEVRPQSGSYVSRIDVHAVISAQFVREAVEADIVRCVAAQATSSDIAGLEAMLDTQMKTATIVDPQPFVAADEAFHRQLAEIAGQKNGWEFLQPLKTQMDRVRYLSARSFPRPVLISQHREIVDAIRQGNIDDAEQRMRRHLRRILEDLPAVAGALPNFFRQSAQ
jgi:DNA-binding GntR family transcriptional regulator